LSSNLLKFGQIQIADMNREGLGQIVESDRKFFKNYYSQSESNQELFARLDQKWKK